MNSHIYLELLLLYDTEISLTISYNLSFSDCETHVSISSFLLLTGKQINIDKRSHIT